nr:hypothetical protein [uncultured Mediterranean phage uvMED]
MRVDAVITDLELQLETQNNAFGSFVAFRFIDVFPNFPRVNEMISDIKKRNDVELIDYEYTYKGIDEDTDISQLEVVKH